MRMAGRTAIIVICLGALTDGAILRRKDSNVLVAHADRRTHEHNVLGMQQRVELLVQGMMEYKDTSSRHIADKVGKKMKLSDAVSKLEGKLPADVMSLVHVSAKDDGSKSKGQFSEVSLEKARLYLNNMMYDAWLQLDQIEVTCKEFEESNRATFDQIVKDIDILGSYLADRYRMKTEAEGCITQTSFDMRTTIENRRTLDREFNKEREANSAELSLRQDDQDVFTAILQLSKCPNDYGDDSYSLSQIDVCETQRGTVIESKDPKLAEGLKKSPRVMKAVADILADGNVTMLQTGQAPPPEPLAKKLAEWKKCRNPKVNCGLLHDTMSLEWGKFKDLVDELTYIMLQNDQAYRGARENLNEQIATLKSNKMKCQELLSEAVSDINSMTAEKREKEEQHREVEKAYKFQMGECVKQITEILFTNICGVKIVRNALMRYSTVSPTKSIVDCDITEWSPGPCTIDGRGQSAAVDCDDGCPADVGGVDVDACGGMKYLTRQVIVSNNEFGMACPPLFFERKNGTKGMKCNQFKCPVNCVMSEWSGWSACSKECGGGTQGKTRSILTKNKNGGSECDTTLESQPCNTGSCDRDCTLEPWTNWEPCSMACGGGLQKRMRHVDIPIRANGKCPSPDHADRLQEQECNTMDCEGDEICIAKQDLVLAIDGSGSLKQEGFDILKGFALNLTSMYQPKYYGASAMQVGLVLFGNGEYFDNGTVSAAVQVQGLTDDIAGVDEEIKKLQWQRGFTNMMQAFAAAEVMFGDGRSEAQSAVIILSDGKYTNAYRTGQKVQAMKDAGVWIYMAPVAEHETDQIKVIKSWATQPWETNYERIPGIESLEGNEASYARMLMVKFCPRAFSVSRKKAEDERRGYVKIHEEGYPSDSCGVWRYMGVQETEQACMERVKSAGMCPEDHPHVYWWGHLCCSENTESEFWPFGGHCDGSQLHAWGQESVCCKGTSVWCPHGRCTDYSEKSENLAFAFEEGGRWHGTCYSEAIDVTPEMWDDALEDQVDIECPGGAWVYNYYASTFIMNPNQFGNFFDE